MKKTYLLGIIMIVLASLVLAQGPQEANEPGTGNAEMNDAGQGMAEEEMQANEVKGNPARQLGANNRIISGEFMSEQGKRMRFEKMMNNRMRFHVGNAVANTTLELRREEVQNRSRIRAQLSNGKNAEIKVMPDAASEKALERLRLRVCSEENGCQIELKEVGQGEEAKPAYEVKARKRARVFGLFNAQMQVQARVNAENGEVMSSKKPWWAFLATEPEA